MTDDGLTQFNAPVAAVPEGEGETVGLRVGVGVGVSVPVVGVGVAPPETIVKGNCALRCVMASLAWMVCCPMDQPGSMVMLTLKAPLPSALMVLLAAGWNSCAAVIFKALVV